MAEEKEAAPAEQPKQKSPIVLIAVLVLVGVILSGAVAFFVATKFMAPGGDEGGTSRHHDPGIFVKLGDSKDGSIMVNVGGSKSSKFLKAGIVLEMNPGKKDNLHEGKLTDVASVKIHDVTMQMLRSSKLEEFDSNNQVELKKKLKDELNEALGEGSVYDVYITSFLLQ